MQLYIHFLLPKTDVSKMVPISQQIQYIEVRFLQKTFSISTQKNVVFQCSPQFELNKLIVLEVLFLVSDPCHLSPSRKYLMHYYTENQVQSPVGKEYNKLVPKNLYRRNQVSLFAITQLVYLYSHLYIHHYNFFLPFRL